MHPFDPLQRQIFGVNDDHGRLSPDGNDVKGHDGLAAASRCTQRAEIPRQHLIDGLFLKCLQLTVEGHGCIRQPTPAIFDINGLPLSPANQHQLTHEAPGDKQSIVP